jgi:diguanylate cyclase (GGDEF)-like protein
MILVAAAAVLNCAWLIPFHPDAAADVLTLNLALVVVAVSGYASIRTFARRQPEVIVFVVLVAVDVATAALGLGDSALGLIADGYLLLLPTIVALVIPWATPIHVTWLAVHGALAVAYTVIAPRASDEFLELLIVAIVVSQAGHVANLRARVHGFVQTERIRALNRQANRDQARLDRLNIALGKAANTDELTALGNRLALSTGLKVVRSRIERQGDRYGLLILDLDRFKAINDALGHLHGDTVLRLVSGALAQTLRPGDSAYRYGGEEFVVLMRVTAEADALSAAERIRRTIEALQIPNADNKPYGRLTVSIGVSTIGPEELAIDDEAWLASADAALYAAKANGRNRCMTGVETRPTGPT